MFPILKKLLTEFKYLISFPKLVFVTYQFYFINVLFDM